MIAACMSFTSFRVLHAARLEAGPNGLLTVSKPFANESPAQRRTFRTSGRAGVHRSVSDARSGDEERRDPTIVCGPSRDRGTEQSDERGEASGWPPRPPARLSSGDAEREPSSSRRSEPEPHGDRAACRPGRTSPSERCSRHVAAAARRRAAAADRATFHDGVMHVATAAVERLTAACALRHRDTQRHRLAGDRPRRAERRLPEHDQRRDARPSWWRGRVRPRHDAVRGAVPTLDRVGDHLHRDDDEVERAPVRPASAGLEADLLDVP